MCLLRLHYVVVEVMGTLAHSTGPKESLVHDAGLNAHLIALLLEAEQGVLEAAQVATPS